MCFFAKLQFFNEIDDTSTFELKVPIVQILFDLPHILKDTNRTASYWISGDQYIYPFTCVIFILDGDLSEACWSWQMETIFVAAPSSIFFSATFFAFSSHLFVILPLLEQDDVGDINISCALACPHSSLLQHDQFGNINEFTVASVKLNRRHQCLRWWGRWTSRSCGRWGRW